MKISAKISEWRQAAQDFVSAMPQSKKIAFGVIATATLAGAVWSAGPVYSCSVIGFAMILPFVAQAIIRDARKASAQLKGQGSLDHDKDESAKPARIGFIKRNAVMFTAFAGFGFVLFGAGIQEENIKLGDEAKAKVMELKQQAYEKLKDNWQSNERAVTLKDAAWQRGTRDWKKKPLPLSVQAEMTGPSNDGIYTIQFDSNLPKDKPQSIECIRVGKTLMMFTIEAKVPAPLVK